MAIYKYVAFDAKGKEQKGILDASNTSSVRKILRSRNLYVRTISEDTERKDRNLFPFLSKFLYRVPRREVGLLARRLGTLIDAGLTLDRSLNNIISQTSNEYLRKTLIEIRTDVLEGMALSDAMQKHPSIFTPIYYNLVAVGEQTGNYEQALLRLADLEDSTDALRTKVMNAAFYPIIMLFLLGSILFFLMSVVVPQITELFVELDQELPLITRILIGTSNIFSSVWILVIFAGIGGCIFLFNRWKSS